jgi:uncharacterized protein YlxP (DUF503 family)
MTAKFHVLILQLDLHIPASQSLKAKRSSITPIIRHIDQLAGVGSAEVDHHDTWQRTTIGVSAVGNSVSHVENTIDGVERFVWSRPDVEVLDAIRSWWDADA